MTSEKQLLANQKNALLSTGPKSIQGKLIVSTNAIKHGIFAKDVLIPTHIGKEDEEEYLDLYRNLLSCLAPQNQMESLLVEKIAIDYWRLRRVLRFETGSIGKHLKTVFKDFYAFGGKTSKEIDLEIERRKGTIEWINSYLRHLKQGDVTFDSPSWQAGAFISDILKDLHLIINSIRSMPFEDKIQLSHSTNFGKLKTALTGYGYGSDHDISIKLIEIYTHQVEVLEKELEELEKKKVANIESDTINSLIGLMPQQENIDKILKYEQSIQKSIFQNLVLLKKLQGSF